MPIKIFIYKIETGELISEHPYNDFLFIFNNLISYNFIYENDKINLIIGTEFPPIDMFYKNKEWISKKRYSTNEFAKLIKIF